MKPLHLFKQKATSTAMDSSQWMLFNLEGFFMTTKQKEEILALRQSGITFLEISKALDLSRNTVKSFCQRQQSNKVELPQKEKTICPNCGKRLNINKVGRPQKFCCENCRRAWWKNNKQELARMTFYDIKCAFCGREFSSYGNKNRKFCSHECYVNKKLDRSSSRDDNLTI